MKALRISQTLRRAIVSHAIGTAPRECCGILSGTGNWAKKIHPCDNIADQEDRYELDPRDQLAAVKQIEKDGEEIVAIYHSHVNESAYPSITDIELAHYPSAVYLIASLSDVPLAAYGDLLPQDANGEQVEEGSIELRGFRIESRAVTEVDLIE